MRVIISVILVLAAIFTPISQNYVVEQSTASSILWTSTVTTAVFVSGFFANAHAAGSCNWASFTVQIGADTEALGGVISSYGYGAPLDGTSFYIMTKGQFKQTSPVLCGNPSSALFAAQLVGTSYNFNWKPPTPGDYIIAFAWGGTPGLINFSNGIAISVHLEEVRSYALVYEVSTLVTIPPPSTRTDTVMETTTSSSISSIAVQSLALLFALAFGVAILLLVNSRRKQ